MDNQFGHDALDHLLFDTAAQLSADMHLDSAWAQIQATHRRNRRRKALLRYTPLAATLVIGLGLGLLLSPVILPKSAPTAEDMSLAQDMPMPAPAAPIPEESGGMLSEQESVVVEGPNGPEEYIVVDPPKTSGPGVEDATPGEIHTFLHLAGKFGIMQLLPAWLPEGMDALTIEMAENAWRTSGPAGNAHGYYALYARVSNMPARDDLPALAIGEGIPYYLRMDGESEATWCEWHIRLDEASYLLLASEYMDFEDVVKVLEGLGLEARE